MGWLRKVWDGPFITPPQQPITVGWVLLKLSEMLWRLLLIVVLLGALLGIYFWQSVENPLSSKVGIELSPAPSECVAKGWPIFAQIENKSSKTIGELGLKFRVYPHGTSVDVVSYEHPQPDLHNILRPGQVLNWCFRMPQLQAGSTGPYTVAADVSYALELEKNVPITSLPPPKPDPALTPPPLVRIGPPPSPGFHPPAPPKTVWTWAWELIGVVIFFALFVGGSFGLIVLIRRLSGTWVLERFRSKTGDNAFYLVILFGILNAIVVWAGQTVLSSAGWDAWETQVDVWSWAHGFEDGGSMVVFAAACQWPWAVWLALDGPKHIQV